MKRADRLRYRENGAERHNLLLRKLIFFLWERLSSRDKSNASGSWLEATPTRATLHYREDGANRLNRIFANS
jgi:hypothetical protein